MPPALYTAEEAERIIVAAGYKTLRRHPYPGTVSAPWLVKCATCGDERTVFLYKVARGLQRCAHGRRDSKKKQFNLADVVKRYKAGASIRALARELGMSPATLHGRLAKVEGLEMRPPGGRRQAETRVRRSRGG